MAPFVFVGDVGKRLVGVTDDEADKLSNDDYAMVEAATSDMLSSDRVGDRKSWSNKKTGSSGYVRLLDIFEDFDTEHECRELEIMVQIKDEVLGKKTITLCQNDKGEWDFQ